MKLFKNYFLRWWLIALVVAVIAFWGWYAGIFELMYLYDHSKLTFVTLAVFLYSSVVIGISTYKVTDENFNEEVQKERQEFGWFTAELCMALGLLGTVIGFIIMMNADITSFTAADPASVQRLIGIISSSMGTAFYTTAVGLTTSILLKLQSYNLYKYINRLKHNDENGWKNLT